MKKINCFIQARFNSVRLPGKVLMDFGGYNALTLMTKRLKSKKLFSKIIIVTGSKKLNIPITLWAKRNHLDIFYGSEENVL